MTPAGPSRRRRIDAVIGGLALLVLALQLFLSPMGLGALGWNYDGIGGSPPMRFHPATYLTLVLFVLVALRDGNPLQSLIRAFGSDMRLTLYVLVWSVLLWHGARNQELPAAALVDTFLLPALMLVIFRRLDEETKARMRVLLHVGLAANALLGIAEMVLGFRLTPFIAGGIPITTDWRSTAFLGHPLSNSLFTGLYAAILLLGGAPELRGWPRALMIALMFAAMVPFGGRASFVLLIAIGAGVLALSLLRFLAGQRVSLVQITALLVVMPVLIAGLGAAMELGVFDKFLLRFTSDDGSAQARVVMFELFRAFTLQELLLGPPQQQLNYLVQVLGIEYGIESLWVAFALFYGIIPAVLFFCGLLLFITSLLSHCRPGAWIVIGYFFLVNSTFLGIAGKTIMFVNLCLLLLLLMPAPVTLARRPAARPAGAAPRWREAAPC